MSIAVAPLRAQREQWSAVRRYGRPALAVGLVLFAYRTSLATLIEAMRLDTPLAHLALVPMIAGGLAYASRHNDAGPEIHDRQLDWIVGLLLCSVAVVTNTILPGRLSTQYWIWRLDLLSLPVFVAGVVAIVFGVRSVWKYRTAILFLFLAWPLPYSVALDRYLGRFTELTISALTSALSHIPIAARVVGSDSLFQIDYQGLPIKVSVASACSGANGLVGFLLVASAFVLVVDGSRFRKISWLVAGAVLVWVLNIVRILIIFWAARQWGESVAIEGFHPYTGLVVFNLAVGLMILAMRLFGLRFRPVSNSPRTSPGSRSSGSSRQPTFAALTCAGLMALTVGVFNGDLRSYDKIANSFGAPRLADFQASRETPAGWQLVDAEQYDWAKRFFGSTSSWNRYLYSVQPDSTSQLFSNTTVIADIIETSDRAALSAYGVEACYSFHNYAISGQQSVDLGSGLVGGMLTWFNPQTSLTYTTLYWHWPVKTTSGTRYERVTLMLQDQPTNEFRSPPLATELTRQLQLDINDLLRGVGNEQNRARIVETRQFLIGFGRELVSLRQPAETT